MMKVLKQISLMVLVLFLLNASRASALTVDTAFIGGDAPANTAGGGNLADIVAAAARIWESAYADQIKITIYYGWAPIRDAGTHTLVEQGGVPNRELKGILLFDNSGAVAYFLDPTPEANEEYRRRTEEYQDLGGGFVNVARLYSQPIGDAVGRVDLLSVALHEMGHALGMCIANRNFMDANIPGVLTISGEFPYAGTVIPLARNNAGFTSHFDPFLVTYGSVMAGICGDERRLPSALDILANAELSGFEIENLDPQQYLSSRAAGARGTGHAENNAPSTRTSK